eukprot:4667622-Pyramimonas_sp.AAC.1
MEAAKAGGVKFFTILQAKPEDKKVVVAAHLERSRHCSIILPMVARWGPAGDCSLQAGRATPIKMDLRYFISPDCVGKLAAWE